MRAKTANQQEPEPNRVDKTFSRKLWELAESPILWGGLGVLIGAVTSLISLRAMFYMQP
jgi:hypothetical protein